MLALVRVPGQVLLPLCQNPEQPDPAAVFACARSLWEYGDNNFKLGELYYGMDGFMRAIMQVGHSFESWACKHVAFNELNDCWPYLLQMNFGRSCFHLLEPHALEGFNEEDCLRIALHLKIPIRLDGDLPIPVSFTERNPNPDSEFRKIRIHTVHDMLEENETVQLVIGDDPFDEEYGKPYFGLYGVASHGTLEHIAVRQTYLAAVQHGPTGF